MAQIIRITSEALQATIRRLLPSQQGFGEDLQASNVILPVIDVTPTAEGSQLPLLLSTATSFSDATAFSVVNSSTVVANTPGFYKFSAAVTLFNTGATNHTASIISSDGLSNKTLWQVGGGFNASGINNVDFTFFLDTGDTLTASSSGGNAVFAGSIRQIADRYGNIQNPAGFTFE